MEQLLNEAIESYNAYIGKVSPGCERIVELFREEKYEMGLNNVANFAEGLMWMMEMTELFKKNNVAVEFDLEQVQEFFVEITSAIEAQDYNLLADLFEYELVEFFAAIKPIQEA